jgi:anti-sigma factor RsiW
MSCTDVRASLLAYHAGRLEPAALDAVRAHLDDCSACAHEDAAEQALTEALERRLPQHPAPIALKRRLAREWSAAPLTPARQWPWRIALAAGATVAALVILVVALAPWRAAPGVQALVAEAVNDHLRVIERGSLPVASSGIHDVKPWFTGQIDFAPVVPFVGDAEFPLRGGAVERFLDRKAAVLVYGRRRHTVSLLVFRSDGLAWPSGPPAPHVARVRGFNVLAWRAGDLGYALVSDVDTRDLSELGRRLGAP